MQHRGAHAGKGCTGDVHAGGAEQACTAGNNGREQIGRAAQGAGRDGQRRPGRTHMQEGKERGLGPAADCMCSAQGIKGGSGVYIGMERGFLACVPREESGGGSGCREKKNGLGCWFGPKRFFLFFFLFAKRFNKFDLNLNSTNSNSNQTTSNKTMQSCMNANKQPHLDLEKQPIFFYSY